MPRPKRLSAQAIEVLSTLEVEGTAARCLVRITAGQLDRKLYTEVNEALVALGGKWSKKDKVHVFEGDPRPAIERVAVDGEFTDEAREYEFFATPPEVAGRLLNLVDLQPKDLVLEPSCGEGALIGAIIGREPKAEVHAFEIRDSAATKAYEKYPDENVIICTKDFLTLTPKQRFKFVLMNPPFSGQQDITHVLHAYKFLKPEGKLVSVMGAGVTFRQDRKATSFRDFVSERGGSITELPKGSFRTSGTMVNTVIVEVPA